MAGLRRRALSQYRELVVVGAAAAIGLTIRGPLLWLVRHQGIDIFLVILVLSSAITIEPQSLRRLPSSWRQLSLALAIGISILPALSWLAAAVGLLARSAEAATSFTMVLMFVPYVSTAFVPANTMPAALDDFARYQPFTPIIETMRGLWMGPTSTGAAVGHEAWIAITYCACILAAS